MGDIKETKVKANEHICPRCHSQVSPTSTTCPNCFVSLDSSSTNTGKMEVSIPDQAKPKHAPQPGQNVQISEVLFDSNTGRFVVAISEHPKDSFLEDRRKRKRFFPNMKDLPRVKEDLPSKEFKMVVDPKALADKSLLERKQKVDGLTKSCDDLAIDG